MTEHQFKSFLKACREDANLRDRISQAKTTDEAITIAKDAGFSIEASDLVGPSTELSDKELENVAGGNLGPSFMCGFSDNPCVPQTQENCPGPVIF
jgi:predicted ribosomally synthesized peptide with nif11-like leader